MKPALESMEAYWAMFATARYTGLSEGELAEARMVFYAGGFSVFAYLTDQVPALGEAEGQRAIGAMHREFTAFVHQERERERRPVDPDTRH